MHKVLTVGPSLNANGGIASVLATYKRNFADFHFEATNSPRGTFAGLFVLGGLMLKLPFYRLVGYDIIHAHGATGKSFVRKRTVLAWARILGFKTVFHNHGGTFPTYVEKFGKERMKKILAGYDAVAVLSDSWADYFRSELGIANPVVIPNIIEEPTISARPASGPMRLIFLGKICREKGLYDLLKALGDHRDEFAGRIRLLIGGLGSAADEQKMREMISSFGLECMTEILGWVGGQAKEELLAQGGVMILPSYVEGVPICLLEAGVRGMASIATPVGGIPGIITDGENGFIVPVGDSEELAKAIRSYLENPSLAMSHGFNAQKRVKANLPSAVHDALMRLYDSF